MKVRNILCGLTIIVFMATPLAVQANTNPTVTNVAFSITGTTVTVTYNVADQEQPTVTISMEVSSDGGTTWDYNFNSPTPATGDIGAGITTGGATKTITWTYSGVYNDQFIIRIIANDLVIDGGPCADATITYSGKTYNTVQVGTQCWLKENLDVGVYVASTNTGSTHSNVSNNGIIEKYCYGNNEANCATYGGLYDWNEAMQYVTTPGTQGICPTGWHIPTLAEFQTLSNAVGGNGSALKAGGANTSGFSALLAGDRRNTGVFENSTQFAYFWSSTENNATYAHKMTLWNGDSGITMETFIKENGYSVRCLKD